jgi:hypothetical protein
MPCFQSLYHLKSNHSLVDRHIDARTRPTAVYHPHHPNIPIHRQNDRTRPKTHDHHVRLPIPLCHEFLRSTHNQLPNPDSMTGSVLGGGGRSKSKIADRTVYPIQVWLQRAISKRNSGSGCLINGHSQARLLQWLCVAILNYWIRSNHFS